MADSISVVIPVGPLPHHRRWLKECLDSLLAQTRQPDSVILVNDGGSPLTDLPAGLVYVIVENEMRLGMVASFNRGVATAPGLALTLGSDDVLLPHALADAEATWKKYRRENAYYYFDVAYSDGRPSQSIACHAAMVHAGWYKSIGGLPPESAVGAPDTMLISMIMAKRIHADLLNIKSAIPPYWYRVHDLTDTNTRRDPRMQGAIHSVRAYLSEAYLPLGATA